VESIINRRKQLMAGVPNIPKATRKVLGIGYKQPKKRRGQKRYEVQHMPHAEFKERNPVEHTEWIGKDGKVHKTFRKPGSVSVNRRGIGGRDELRDLKSVL
jgi:hypothetical protein